MLNVLLVIFQLITRIYHPETIDSLNESKYEYVSVAGVVNAVMLNGGGAGSGKSDVLLMYGIVHKWHEHARFKQVLMRRTHQELKKEIVPRSREIFRRFGATWNGTDMCWTFPRLGPDGKSCDVGRNTGAM